MQSQFSKRVVVLLLGFAWLSFQPQVLPQSPPQPSPKVIETGTFRFYDTKQLMGEEKYEIKSGAAGTIEATMKLDLPFMGEEQKPSLTAVLRMKTDLTPQKFEINGIRPLGVETNIAVSIKGKTATIGSVNPKPASGNPTAGGREVAVGDRFFTFGGYVPVTTEMMLVRYWLAHGKPARLQLVPEGEALVEHRGRDTVTIAGKRIALERFHLSGVGWRGGWGRQTLWFDSEYHLVAAVNLAADAETNVTAIRDGYDEALRFFLKRTIEDHVERLTLIADQLSPKTTKPLALVGGTLIDGAGNPPVENSAIVIQGDRIIAAGPRSEVKIPEGATIADATGKYILPGLWDMHSHMYQAELGPAYLAAGITSAQDMGNEIEFATTMRDAAKRGRGLGPRLLLAGYINGKNDFHNFDVQVGTPDEARAAVQSYKNAGFDQIKIRDHVKPDILRVITAEAHRLGMMVTGHVPESMNAIQAVEAGMDHLSHLNYAESAFAPDLPRGQPLFEVDLDSPQAKKALQVLKEHGTVIDPTAAVLELMIRPMNRPIESIEPGVTQIAPELLEQINMKGAPAEAAAQIDAAIATLLKIIGALNTARIPIIAGTDVGVPGHTLHRELELYVKAGMTPLEAIQTATLTPARVMKLDKEVGTIEVGKRADLVILAGNPLENISNIRKVKFVVAQGRLFDCSKLRETIGFKP